VTKKQERTIEDPHAPLIERARGFYLRKPVVAFSAMIAIIGVAAGAFTSTRVDKVATSVDPVLIAADRPFGENAGDAPARVCAAAIPYNPSAVARSDAATRDLETVKAVTSLTRGTTSLSDMDVCLMDRMVPSVAVGDLDGDYLPEVLSYKRPGVLRLYWNQGGTFEPEVINQLSLIATEKLGSKGKALPANQQKSPFEYDQTFVITDVDDDGLNDIVLLPYNAGPEITVLRNLGNRTFAENATSSPVENHSGSTNSATTADINRDGIADIVSTTRRSVRSLLGAKEVHLVRIFMSTGGKAPYYVEETSKLMPNALPDEASSRNAGSLASNAIMPFSPFLPVVADFDRDGSDDIFVSADRGGSRIYFREGDKFVDHTKSSGVALSTNGMGAATLDVNDDGLLDIYVTEIDYDYSGCPYNRACDYSSIGNLLLVNNGDRTFTDQAAKYGLAESGWGWGFANADFNLDGRADFFIGVGQNARGRGEEDWSASFHRPWLYVAKADGTYRDATGSVFRSLIMPGSTQMVMAADFDGDFRPDVLVGGEDSRRPYLLLNRTPVGNGSTVVIKGRGLGGSPRNGEGAVVSVMIEGRKTDTFTLMSRVGNFLVTGASTPLTIGLGEQKTATVKVTYPSGEVVTATVHAGRINLISEPKG
jgi:hypothetical protein